MNSLCSNEVPVMPDCDCSGRTRKQIEIASEIIYAAAKIQNLIDVAFPKKRVFPKIDRTPGKRMKKLQARLNLIMAPSILRANIHMKMAQPIPKFPPGSKSPSGFAIVGEQGPEIILINDPQIKYTRPDLNTTSGFLDHVIANRKK